MNSVLNHSPLKDFVKNFNRLQLFLGVYLQGVIVFNTEIHLKEWLVRQNMVLDIKYMTENSYRTQFKLHWQKNKSISLYRLALSNQCKSCIDFPIAFIGDGCGGDHFLLKIIRDFQNLIETFSARRGGFSIKKKSPFHSYFTLWHLLF